MALVDQMMRASRLDIPFYEEVERDTTQTNNALTVVVVTALAAGISGAISGAMSGAGGGTIVLGLIGGIVAAVIGWGVWCGIVYFVGTKMFGGTATWGEVLRTVGFAQSPNVLRILSFIPILGALISLVAGIWALIASVIAVRQSLDIGTGAAVIVSIIGFVVYILIFAIVGGILGLGGMALGTLG
jgi:hypothetical protein